MATAVDNCSDIAAADAAAPIKITTVDSDSPGDAEDGSDIVYKVEDVPPWYLSIVLGLQHYLTMFSGALAIPYLIASKLCMGEHDPGRGHIINTTFFASGFATFLQATFGIRLPIIQGPSLSFLIPALAVLDLPQWKCPDLSKIQNITRAETDEIWMSRMREIQGAIIVASAIEVLVGLTGVIGLLMKWITPLTIAPTITLIGLSLFHQAALSSSGQWGIAVFTMIILIGCSQYLGNVNAPHFSYSKEKGCHIGWFPFFKLFPVMLTIAVAWGLCAILTITDVLPDDSEARTDLKTALLQDTEWFRVPYPGQWGMPTISLGAVLGLLAGVMASTIESVGDYYACARLSGAPPPPTHAINRGIFMEGMGCILAGICGTGSGLTSFSQNIGAIGITKVGSRRVIQFAAIIITLSGLVGKFGTLFVTIPAPIMGGVFCIMFSIITGVGLSNLQFVNLNSTRNLFILGFSIFMGLCIPEWMNSNKTAIKTGSEYADQIFTILLSTSMFVGGFLGCILDNTIPGSKEERGIIKWHEQETKACSHISCSVTQCYDLPFGMELLKKSKCLAYLPISPTYDNQLIADKIRCKTRSVSQPPSKDIELTTI